jgi:ABC-type amino acid transport system permease subunit
MVPTVVPPLMAKFVVAAAVDCNSTVPALTAAPLVTVPAGAAAMLIVIGLVTLLEKPALATVALIDGLPALMLAATLTVIVTGSLTPALHEEVRVQVSVEATQAPIPANPSWQPASGPPEA